MGHTARMQELLAQAGYTFNKSCTYWVCNDGATGECIAQALQLAKCIEEAAKALGVW